MDRPYVSRVDADTRTISVEGVLDELSVPRFRSDLFAFVDESAAASSDDGSVTVSVELTEVEFLLSVAIAALAAAKRHADDIGAQIRFVAAAGSIAARILDICGLPYETTPDERDATAQQGPADEDGGPRA